MAEEKKKAKHERAAAAMGGGKKKESKKKKGKHKVHTIHVSKLDSGGYLAKHDVEPDPNDPTMGGAQPQHAIPDEQGLADHFAEHMPSGGDNEAAEGEAPAGGPPAGGAPPAAAGPGGM